jgi:hypothetical protein
MPEVNVEICPDCGRDLRPHAAAGKCPECGFEFDAHTRVWRSSRSWQRHFLYNALVGLTAGILLTIAHRLLHGEVPNPLLPILTGLAVALAGLAFDRVLGGRLSGRFVALTPAGIVLGTRRRPRLIVWDEIHRLNTRGRVPKLELTSDAADVPLEDLFDTPAEFDDFRRALQQARPA